MAEELPLKPIKSIVTYQGKEPGESIVLDEENSRITMKMFTSTGGHITVTLPWYDNRQIAVTYITALGLTGYKGPRMPWDE